MPNTLQLKQACNMENLTNQGLSLALRHNIEAFKRIKNTKEKAQIQATNKLMPEENNKKYEAPPQTKTHLEPTIVEEKKEDSESKQIEKGNTSDIVKSQKDIENEEKVVEKQSNIEAGQAQKSTKKEDKTTKFKNEQEHFISYMADIPIFDKFSNKEILKRKEDLLKRHIEVWPTSDPAASKRLRFLKHLQ